MYEDQASFQDFRTDGYVVINNFLSRTELKVLRQVQILVRQLCKAQQVQSHNHLVQECDVLVKHAFEHLAIQGTAQPGWEVIQK